MDFVFDLETLGKESGAIILTIGLAVVDRGSSEVQEDHYWRIDPECYGDGSTPEFDADISTVGWWMKQSDAARREAFGGDVPLDTALSDICDVITGGGGVHNAKVWGNGATFDITILEEAFRRMGHDVPWSFWNARCLRTLCAEMRVDWKKHLPRGGAHVAVEDAKAEALGLIECFAKLRQLADG